MAFRQDVPKRSTLLDDINNKILRAEVFVFFLAMSGRLSKNRQYFNDLALIHIDTTCVFEHAPKMLIDHQQLHIVRLSLDMSARDLARVSGLSAGGISQIERTGGFQASTMRVLQQALADRGALFGADGSVGVRMKWQGARPRDPQVRSSVLKILNSARKSRGQCDLIDIGDGP